MHNNVTETQKTLYYAKKTRTKRVYFYGYEVQKQATLICSNRNP